MDRTCPQGWRRRIRHKKTDRREGEPQLRLSDSSGLSGQRLEGFKRRQEKTPVKFVCLREKVHPISVKNLRIETWYVTFRTLPNLL